MRRKVLQAVGAIWLAALALLASSAAIAQQATTLALSSHSVQIEDLLRQGRQLELQRRWGEALTHYEDALRLFPAEQSIERRFDSARLHYDLGRRYADRSFCQSLAQLSAEKALELYAAVLLKIQTHYVEEPNWRELLRHGGNDFEVALGEPIFREQNIPARDWPAIEAFRLEAAEDARRADRGDPPGRLRRRGGRRRAGPATPGNAPGRGDPGIPLRGGQRTGSLLDLPHPGPTRRSLFANRGQLRRPGGRAEDPGRRTGHCAGHQRQPRRTGRRPCRTTASSPSTAGSVKEMPTDQAANLLQGREGTTVTLTLAAAGPTAPVAQHPPPAGRSPQRR